MLFDIGILQITIVTLSYWYLGFLYGSGFLFLLYHVAENLLIALGYQPVPFVDIGMEFEKKDGTNNLVAYFEAESLDLDSVKKRIYEQGISKIKNLHYVRSYILGLALFKIATEEEAKLQIKRVNKEVKTDKEVIDYCSHLAQYKIDRSKPNWECHVQENYTKNTSLVFFVMQHGLIDAVGYASLMSCLLDNQFKLKMKKKFTPISFAWKVFYCVFALPYTSYMSFKYKMIKSDDGAEKVQEQTDPNTLQKNCYSTVELDFAAVKKCYKRFKGVTFGDYFMGVVSKAFHDWYREQGIDNANNIKAVVSVNNRDFPQGYDSLILGTRIAVFECHFPLLGNFEKAITESKKAFRSIYSEHGAQLIELFFSIFKFFPKAAVRHLAEDMLGGIGCAISNVPFSEEQWIFCGKKVLKQGFWAHGSEHIGIFITPITYGDKLRVNFTANRTMKLSGQKLVSQFEKVINEDIAEGAK